MIVLNTTEDTKRSNIPSFVADKVLSLLSVYQSDSLKDYGSVIIIEAEEELSSIDINAIEFTEKILCDDSVYWHLTIPKSNSKSSLPDNQVDYLQVFSLTREVVGDTVFQKIENTQEVPPCKSVVSFPLDEAVTQKVFCIDSEEYFTFMLAEEY